MNTGIKTMPYKVVFVFFSIVAVTCFITGYLVESQWVGMGLALFLLPGWLLANKYPASLLPSLCLVLSAGLAAVGILIRLNTGLMVGATVAALVAWDLLLFNASFNHRPSNGESQDFSTHHLKTVLLVSGAGLLAVLLGQFLSFQIPFLIMLVLAVLIVFALERTWFYLKKRKI